MSRLLNHKLLIGLVSVLVVAGGGAAYAATQTGTNSQQALLNDVAKRLNISPSKLRSAIQGALLDRLQAAVKAGELTQAQANRLKQRIEKGGLPLGPVAGGGFWLHRQGPIGRFGFAEPRQFFGPFAAASKYLGISAPQLLGDLRGGKTLAQLAQSHGKSVSGLEQALVAAEKGRLDRLVAAGVLTKAQEQRGLSVLTKAIDRLVERARIMVPPWEMRSGKAPSFRPGRPPAIPPGLFGGGPGGPPAGGPAEAVPPPGGPAKAGGPAGAVPPPGGPGGPPPPAA